MASGQTPVLYSVSDHWNTHIIQVTAAYSKFNLTHEEFEVGKTNVCEDFLKKFPNGKAPAFEGNGVCLYETDAIAFFVANEQLRGGDSVLDQALVRQYISFATHEITPAVCTWAFPSLGLRPNNKQEIESAKETAKKCLSILDNVLLTKTFLVGERVTLADIKLACCLLLGYKVVFDPKFREPYHNVNRWFLTCVNQPDFKKFVGDVKLCDAVATFNAKKYTELHPKGGKKGKDTQQTVKKEDKPKEQKPVEEPKPVKPKDVYANLPPPSNSQPFDDWKKMYSNNPIDVSFPWLCENMDCAKDYTFWKAAYRYNEENILGWKTENAISGMLERLESCRKHIFGVCYIFGEAKPFQLECLWMCKGQTPAFSLNDDWNQDMTYYDITQIDMNKPEDRDYCKGMLSKTEFDDRKVYQAKAFK